MDSRFPAHYLMDRRVLRASAPAFRQFVFGTAWSVSNGTDGFIAHEDLPLVQFATAEHAAELVTRELWSESDKGYQIVDFQKHQTSAAQMDAVLENRRKADRERQARKRAKEKEDTDTPKSQGQSRDCHVTFEGKERQGEARKGRSGPASGEEVDLETGEIDSTPISPPEGRTENAPLGSGARVLDATSEGVSSTHAPAPRISNAGKAPGPSELWPDDPPAKGVTTTDTPAGPRDPRPFDFNQFRNPNVNWSDAR